MQRQLQNDRKKLNFENTKTFRFGNAKFLLFVYFLCLLCTKWMQNCNIFFASFFLFHFIQRWNRFLVVPRWHCWSTATIHISSGLIRRRRHANVVAFFVRLTAVPITLFLLAAILNLLTLSMLWLHRVERALRTELCARSRTHTKFDEINAFEMGERSEENKVRRQTLNGSAGVLDKMHSFCALSKCTAGARVFPLTLSKWKQFRHLIDITNGFFSFILSLAASRSFTCTEAARRCEPTL